MDDKDKSHLQARVQMAGLYREMAQTAGFRDLRKELEAKIADLKNAWMTADEPNASKIRLRAQVYSEIFEIIKSKILQGDMASRQLNGETEPQEQI